MKERSGRNANHTDMRRLEEQTLKRSMLTGLITKAKMDRFLQR